LLLMDALTPGLPIHCTLSPPYTRTNTHTV
jgi:hypothetical protein